MVRENGGLLLVLLPALLFAHLKNLILMFYLQLEFLVSEVQDLDDLLLRVEPINKGALLRYFKELNKEMLFLDAPIADTKLHEEVLQTYLGRVVISGDSHREDPERNCVIDVLRLCQAVVEQGHTHLQNDGAARLMCQ